MSDDLESSLRLAMLPGIGPRTLADLIQRFGTAAAVLSADAAPLSGVRNVGPKLVAAIQHAGDHVDVDAIVHWCDDHRVTILPIGSPHYPQSLQELPDAPPILFVGGELKPCDALAVAIVGTRHATAYGRSQAEKIAYGLAKAGITIVSGMARGIDSAAHQGAIDAGGRTIAVFGCGLGHIYPPENADLSRRIADNGAVVSEFHPQTKPHSGTFPQRNRLISGLSHATLVIEAPERSGSLITARTAYEQGREVLALPGAVTSRASQGTNLLIRDGATLIRNVDDILECLGPLAQPVPTSDGRDVHRPAEALLNDRERLVLDAIATEATAIDNIVQTCGLPVPQVLATISVLEVRRLIRRLSSQYVSRL
ncbi:MAG TPA: DNA-protecting protein DprA [Planctomycetaceae bacterium]|nr:DNA-protecting protein DprA [Planctomycetaceae bacterium]